MGKTLGGLLAPIADLFKYIFDFMISLRKQRRIDFETITAKYDAIIAKQERHIEALEKRLEEQAHRIDVLQDSLDSISNRALSVLSMPWPVWIKLLKPDEQLLLMHNQKYEKVFNVRGLPSGISLRHVYGDDLFNYLNTIEEMYDGVSRPSVYFLRMRHLKEMDTDLLIISWPMDSGGGAKLIATVGIPIEDELIQIIEKILEHGKGQ